VIGAPQSTWTDCDSRARFAAIANVQGLSESALLRRLVTSALTAANTGTDPAGDSRASRLERANLSSLAPK
jgi:hypothetical protein